MNEQELQALDWELNGDDATALLVEQYFADHPRSPSAARRPKIFRQGETFIVVLGRDVQQGIVGLGNTVKNALRAFDLQYYNALWPPEARIVIAKARQQSENEDRDTENGKARDWICEIGPAPDRSRRAD
jgi:hypothetical protein